MSGCFTIFYVWVYMCAQVHMCARVCVQVYVPPVTCLLVSGATVLQVTLSHPNKSCSEALERFIFPTGESGDTQLIHSHLAVQNCPSLCTGTVRWFAVTSRAAESPLGNEDVCSKHVQRWCEASKGAAGAAGSRLTRVGRRVQLLSRGPRVRGHSGVSSGIHAFQVGSESPGIIGLVENRFISSQGVP